MPSAPSRASLNIRPIAFKGLDIVSPVFCKSLLASSESVCEGVERERGWADSSPACGERLPCPKLRLFGVAWEIEGEFGSECGSV